MIYTQIIYNNNNDLNINYFDQINRFIIENIKPLGYNITEENTSKSITP